MIPWMNLEYHCCYIFEKNNKNSSSEELRIALRGIDAIKRRILY